MIQFLCDWCGKVETPADIWILGGRLRRLASTVIQREVGILSAWNETDAVYPFAVHFYSETCKEKYTTEAS